MIAELGAVLMAAAVLFSGRSTCNRIRIRVVWLDINEMCLVHTCKEAKFRFAITDDEVERSISWPLNTVAEDAEINFLNRHSMFNFTMDITGIDLMYGFQRLCDSIFERQVTFQLDRHKGITLHGRCFNTTVIISYENADHPDHNALNNRSDFANDSYVATFSAISATGTVPVWTLMAVAGLTALLMAAINLLVCCLCCRKNRKHDKVVKCTSEAHKRGHDHRHGGRPEQSYYKSQMLLCDGRHVEVHK
ncbi:unnamed protein product [Soboliphyme baturini]|uniref:Envelope glycoprotein L n=1 Tax=Soboliphyme baturini TaxID=241478 RepID=A0A183IF00_9BILA|nr:unnamed protein product [Soboliphyme baturini]